MLTVSSDIKIHDELIIDSDKLCTQLESGNPFLADQDFIFSKEKEYQASEDELCNVKFNVKSEEALYRFFEENLNLSLRRLNKFPHNPAIANGVAIDYLKLGRVEEAIKTLEFALKTDKHFFPAVANLAKCYSVTGNLDKALTIYGKLEQSKKDDIRILSNIALLHFRKKNLNKSLEYYMKSLKFDDKNPSILNNIGLVFLAKGNVSAAISSIRKATKRKNNDHALFNNLGVCYVAINNSKKALYYFKIAHNLNKSARSVLINLSNIYHQIAEHEEVVSILDEYLKAFPDDIELSNALGWSYFELGLYQKCLKELKRVLRHTDENKLEKISSIYYNLGLVYEKLGEIKTAEDYFKKCMKTYVQTNTDIYYNIIGFYLRNEHLEKAKALINYSLAEDSNNPNALSYLGEYYFINNNFEKARKCYYKAIGLDEKILFAYLHLSTIELDVYDNFQEAFDLLKKGLDVYPDNRTLINNYAYCLLLQDKLIEARQILDKIKYDDNVFLTATYGLLLIKEGKLQEGRQAYNNAMAIAFREKKHDVAARVCQKKHLEVAIHYLKEGNKKEVIRNLKKGLKYKSKRIYFEIKLTKLLHELTD